MLGKLTWLDGDVTGALPHVRRATELDPRSDQAWFGLATCYAQMRRYSEAIDALRQAVLRRETSAPYHTALGELLVHRGQVDEGRQQYERALQLDPNDGQACALLGDFLLHNAAGTDAPERAEALLLHATRLENTRPAAVCFDLGQIYIQKGEYGKATGMLQEAIRRDPHDERAYYALANACRRLGNTAAAAAAEAQFRRVSAQNAQRQELEARTRNAPGDLPAHLRLARAYRALGQTQPAMEQYLFYLRRQPQAAAAAREFERFLKQPGHPASGTAGRDFVLPAPQ
jgi:Tfp pilus assembly protein PilF